MERIIFHIDVNNAYLSWEALYRIQELGESLDLRTIPSAIGGDRESRHGIILAKSMPARSDSRNHRRGAEKMSESGYRSAPALGL